MVAGSQNVDWNARAITEEGWSFMKNQMLFIGLPVLIVAFLVCGGEAEAAESDAPSAQKEILDLMWVWGITGVGTDGPHTAASFAQATPAARARLIGVPSIVMAGNGLPRNDGDADARSREVAQAPRLLWEIATDREEGGPPFVYEETIARVRRLAATYPQIEGVLLDDMSSLGIDHGFKPKHIRAVRELLGDTHGQVKVWGVVYTMNLDREGMAGYIRELDVISLWVWHARDIPRMAKDVARLRTEFPGKPIVLGLYLYDYGGGQRMPLARLEEQCATALRLAHAGDIEGMVFLTINDDADTVAWTADWVQKVGDEPVAPSTTGENP
jgi:hypothetical protein